MSGKYLHVTRQDNQLCIRLPACTGEDAPCRTASWASELDLMVRLAGLRLRERYQDWDRGPFTGESQDHSSVYEVTSALAG
jgi:hypothetical protein